MEDRLTLNSESRSFIGHQSLTLSGTDFWDRVNGKVLRLKKRYTHPNHRDWSFRSCRTCTLGTQRCREG